MVAAGKARVSLLIASFVVFGSLSACTQSQADLNDVVGGLAPPAQQHQLASRLKSANGNSNAISIQTKNDLAKRVGVVYELMNRKDSLVFDACTAFLAGSTHALPLLGLNLDLNHQFQVDRQLHVFDRAIQGGSVTTQAIRLGCVVEHFRASAR
jgi:hypothetical protein